MSYANKLSSFELSFLLRATTAHALTGNDPLQMVAAPPQGSAKRTHAREGAGRAQF